MDTVATVGRLLVSLAVVLGVMWLLARRARKGMKRKGNNRVIEVVERANLTRSASIAVVRVHDRTFVLGVAESQVSILGETELDEARTPGSPAPATPARSHRAPVGRTKIVAPAPPPAPSVTVHVPHTAQTVPTAPTPQVTEQQTGALAGSALSPQTWKQTIETLRDLTTRT